MTKYFFRFAKCFSGVRDNSWICKLVWDIQNNICGFNPFIKICNSFSDLINSSTMISKKQFKIKYFFAFCKYSGIAPYPLLYPGVMEGLELPFYSSTPGVLGSFLFPLSLKCPVKHCVEDVALTYSHHMFDPFPSPSHDDGAYAVLVAVGVKMLVGAQPLKNFVKL